MAFLTGKKKQPTYRGFKVPVPLAMLLALRDEMSIEQAGQQAFTCNALGRIAARQTFNAEFNYLNDAHEKVYEDTKRVWAGFLDNLGIYTGGSGFHAEQWPSVGRPDFLAGLHTVGMTPNYLRMVFINDVLKEAFNA